MKENPALSKESDHSEESSSFVQAYVKVTGRVQGVGFRMFVQEEALRLGLSGWVRNCADESV